MKKQKVATDEDFDHVPSSSVGKLGQVAPPTASTTAGAAPNLFYTSEFSTFDYGCWLERMGLTGESSIPEDSMDYIDLYLNHDPSLDLQTNCLMPFERDYILQLVAVIIATLTKTRANMVTPTLRALVIMSWQSLCRLGMKLPLLEKLVATSQKPTALFEAHCSVQEAVKLWEASSDDLRRLRTILASKVEEAFKNSNNDQKALDEVERVSKLVAAKLEEVENDQKVLHEKKKRQQKLTESYWCSFP